MIKAFNRKQTLLAILSLFLGLLSLIVAIAFFYYGSRFVLYNFGAPNAKMISLGITAVGLLVIFLSGFKVLRDGEGTYGYQDSDLMPAWEDGTGGNFAVDFYRNRVTAPAHALTQIFLCAPLQLAKVFARIRSRIQAQPDLEPRLLAVLQEIESQDKWQTISDYPGQSTELQYLIRMDAIQFSGRTGKIRAKN